MQNAHSEAISWNGILESAIVGKLVAALIEDGYTLQTGDNEGGVYWIYAWDTMRRPSKFKHWVKCVWGNGADVISDYTLSLETTIKEVNAFADAFRK